jgi:hypothetical protein
MSEDKQQSAFPHPKAGGVWGSDPVPGLSIRDYFAAKALAAIIANRFLAQNITKDMADNDADAAIAKHAYVLADDMMAEREKK